VFHVQFLHTSANASYFRVVSLTCKGHLRARAHKWILKEHFFSSCQRRCLYPGKGLESIATFWMGVMRNPGFGAFRNDDEDGSECWNSELYWTGAVCKNLPNIGYNFKAFIGSSGFKFCHLASNNKWNNNGFYGNHSGWINNKYAICRCRWLPMELHTMLVAISVSCLTSTHTHTHTHEHSELDSNISCA